MVHNPHAKWIIAILTVGASAAVWIGLRSATGPTAAVSLPKSGATGANSPVIPALHGHEQPVSLAVREQEKAQTRWIRLIDRVERHALAGAALRITRENTPPRSFVTASDGVVNAELVDADVLRVEHEGWFPLELDVGALRNRAQIQNILEIPLERAGRLDVLLQDGGSRPLPGVFVEVLPIDPGTDQPSAELPALWPRSIEFGDSARMDDPFLVHPFTDENGRFVVPLLPRGVPLIVVAHKPGSTIEKRVTIPLDEAGLSVTLSAP